MSAPEPESRKAQPLASAVLKDGGILEMILDADGHRTSFLHLRGEQITECAEFEMPSSGRAVPFSAENNLITHGVVLLPSATEDYGTESDLLGSVRTFIHRYADLSESFEEVASLYVLLSWIYDAFNETPYLRLKGDYGTGKSRCLQVIGSICYKPMFVSGASTVSPMFRIIDAFRGTLILDESDFRFSDERAEIIKILNNGNAAGFPVLRSEATPTKEFNPRAFNVFGPKIIATRRDFEDQALESRCITEVMTGLPPRSDIPLSLPKSFPSDARALRNKLLTYRWRNLARRKSGPMSTTRDEQVEARVAQVLQPLIAIAPDDEIRERIRTIAKRQSGILRSDRSVSVEAQLLDIICELRRDGAALIVRDITTRFAERFGAEHDRSVTPHWIGRQLRKRLNLQSVKSHGSYLLPASEAQKIDGLFARYGIGLDRVDSETSGTY